MFVLSCSIRLRKLLFAALDNDVNKPANDALLARRLGPVSANWRRARAQPCLFPLARHLKKVPEQREEQTTHIGRFFKASVGHGSSPSGTARHTTLEAMRSAGLANLARACSRPSHISHLISVQPRLPSRRYISGNHGAPRSIAKLLDWKPQSDVRDVVVNGFIRSVRTMKARSFVALGDGSSLAPLQALVPTDQAEGYDRILRRVCLGYLHHC